MPKKNKPPFTACDLYGAALVVSREFPRHRRAALAIAASILQSLRNTARKKPRPMPTGRPKTSQRRTKRIARAKADLLVCMRLFFQLHQLPLGGIMGYYAFRDGKWQGVAGVGSCPRAFPSQPNRFFPGTIWRGYADLLGIPRQRRHPLSLLPFNEARAFARLLKLKSVADWRVYRRTDRRPPNIPSNPAAVYTGQGWIGYPDFLGYVPIKDPWPTLRNPNLSSRSEGRPREQAPREARP
jgi:hypothetical protein